MAVAASIYAATGSAVKFLAVKFCRVKFGFAEFQILRRRIFHAFTKYKICKVYLNNKILEFKNFKIWQCKNLPARHGILLFKFHGAKFHKTEFCR